MAEPYLPDQEITISVFADGTSLPIAERFAQKDGFAPTTAMYPSPKTVAQCCMKPPHSTLFVKHANRPC
nr:hypothetical protein [Butyricicoccus sp. AM28-25]